MKKDRVWKLDPFLRLSSFKKEDMLQLLTGIIVSQQVTRIARKKREFVFKMVELDDEVFYNLDEEVVFVYDFDQEREVFHFRLDCYRIRTALETFKRILMVRIILSRNSRAIGFNAVDFLFRIFPEQTYDPTIQ